MLKEISKFFLTATVVTTLSSFAVAEESTAVPNNDLNQPTITEELAAVPPESEIAIDYETEDKGNFYNIGRGFVSIVTAPAEIPRAMVYRNSEVPFYGLIDGFVTGCGMTVLRAFAGVTDVAFLGFDYGLLYNSTLKDFVWEEDWLPPEELEY